MITKAQAISAQVFHSDSHKNSDGTCLRARRNGGTQTWKTRPTEFRIPVKYGIQARGQFSIHDHDANSWHTAEDCTNPKG